MREIKFRGWHIGYKKMFKIGQITMEKGIWQYEPEEKEFIGVNILSQPQFILMQYTGLKDKNGVEIYEGDILAVKKYKRGIAKGIMKYGEFNCSCCLGVYGWYIDTDDDYYLDIREFNTKTMSNSEIEVIGNIYENKELLEGE